MSSVRTGRDRAVANRRHPSIISDALGKVCHSGFAQPGGHGGIVVRRASVDAFEVVDESGLSVNFRKFPHA